MERKVDVANRAKVIEWLKTELMDHVSRLFKGLWEGSSEKLADSIASLILCCYILGRRLGISYRKTDELILQKLRENHEEGHQLEDMYQDLSSLEEHIRKR